MPVLLFSMPDLSVFFQEKFMPFLDMFQKESIKVDASKTIMEAFNRYIYIVPLSRGYYCISCYVVVAKKILDICCYSVATILNLYKSKLYISQLISLNLYI